MAMHAVPGRGSKQATPFRRIGIIGNPRSHAYGPDPPLLLDGAGAIGTAEPASPDALADALRRFAADGVDLLMVRGGDGTVRDVLSLLPGCWPGAPPELAILPTGNTNLAARVFGGIAPGGRALRRFMRAARRNRLRRNRCRTLRVEWKGQPERPPLRGLFLGACLYADGKRLADARIHRRGIHNGVAVALSVAATLLAALLGRGALARGGRRAIAIDGGGSRDGRCFVFLATTLPRLMLGFWPFGGQGGGQGGGTVRWLDIEAPARGLLPILLAAILPGVEAPNRPGHHTGRAHRVALRLDAPFVLDGEFFDPGPDGIVLSDGGEVVLLSAGRWR